MFEDCPILNWQERNYTSAKDRFFPLLRKKAERLFYLREIKAKDVRRHEKAIISAAVDSGLNKFLLYEIKWPVEVEPEANELLDKLFLGLPYRGFEDQPYCLTPYPSQQEITAYDNARLEHKAEGLPLFA